ncbi:MAG: hypothetical protein AAGC58_04335, partial [Asticcacaulis sp.]
LNKSDRDALYTPLTGKNIGSGANRWVWYSTELGDICQYTSADTFCRQGGNGEREQGQTETGLSFELNGDVLGGRLTAGLNYTHAELERNRPRDNWFYSSYRTIADDYPTDWQTRSFICAEGDLSCSPEQYASTLVGYHAYSAKASVDMSNAFIEYDRDIGKWSVRAGVRVDYETYFKNTNLSPRLVVTYKPVQRLAVSGGFNRYYNATTLAYAMRDAMPSQVAYALRRANTTTGVVSGTWTPGNQRFASYKAFELDTPYTDELTASVQWQEPWLNGAFRLRLMERQGKDQFAAVRVSSTNYSLTNDGRNKYKSATAEYGNSWREVWLAERLGVSVSATWSERSTSGDTYFDDDGETSADDFIYYNEQTYTRATFQKVTGNMDIPVRLAMTLSSDWWNDRLNVSVNVGHNFRYDAVRDSNANITIDDRVYNIYEDYQAKGVTTIGLNGSFQIWKRGAQGVDLRFQVDNLLNKFGNAYASVNRPWLRGRAVRASLAVRY